MITLAHSLALHRDPTAWQISEAEKRVRTNVWWAVLIHDYWSSIAHGTPPNIRRENYDVPLSNGQDSFSQLAMLSEILGEILSLVYALRMDPKEATKCLRRTECRVDEWEEQLPPDLRSEVAVTGIDSSSNLHFCYLSIRLLLARVSYKMTIRAGTEALPEAKAYHLASLREAAVKLVEFVVSLQDNQLEEFWLPYTAYLLVSATTTLLRTAIESQEDPRRLCVSLLLRLKARLLQARESIAWDLGDFTLERCGSAIERLAAKVGVVDKALQAPQNDVSENQRAQEMLPMDTAAFDFDLLLPLDSLDFQFDLMDDWLMA